MGFNLLIGEAEPIIYMEERYARMGVREEWGKEFGAPLNSSENYSNKISPGYISWSRFCVQTGLYSVFYAPRCPNSTKTDTYRCRDDCPLCEGNRKSVWWEPEGSAGREGLLHHHPGAAELLGIHLTAFKTAREEWLAKADSVRAEGVGKDRHGNPVDWVLRRLDWLVWWTEWALENCENPTFANS